MRTRSDPFGWYFRPWPFERRLYRRLGVRAFKRYLPTGGDRVPLRMRWHPIAGRAGRLEEALARFEGRTRVAEAAHAVVCTLALYVGIVLMWNRMFVPGGAILLGNVAINLYPIMLQRYNRARILGAAQRIKGGPPGGTR